MLFGDYTKTINLLLEARDGPQKPAIPNQPPLSGAAHALVSPDRITDQERTMILDSRRKGSPGFLLGIIPIIGTFAFFSELADRAVFFRVCSGGVAVCGFFVLISAFMAVPKMRRRIDRDLAEMGATEVEGIISEDPSNPHIKQLTIVGETKPAELVDPRSSLAGVPKGSRVRCRISRHARFLLSFQEISENP